MKGLGIPAWQRKALLTRNREKIRSVANAYVDQHKVEFLTRARAEREKMQGLSMIWLPNSFQGAVLVPAPSQDINALTQRFCDVAGSWTDEDQKILGFSEEKIRPALAMKISDPSAGVRRQAVAPVSLCPPLPPIGSANRA